MEARVSAPPSLWPLQSFGRFLDNTFAFPCLAEIAGYCYDIPTIRCTTAAIPIMQEQGGGRVVNVVGNDGIKSAHWELVPAACNAALLIVMQALGERYGRDGINISCLNPGPVATERMNYLMGVWAESKGIPFEQSVRLHEESIPIGRLCTAEEVANVALFLASDMASFVNATSINVDGGQRKAVVDTLLSYEKGEISPLSS